MSLYSHEQYQQLLQQTKSSLEAMATELDRDIVNNFHQKVPIEFRHDVVPIIKAINNAIKEVSVSISLKH